MRRSHHRRSRSPSPDRDGHRRRQSSSRDRSPRSRQEDRNYKSHNKRRSSDYEKEDGHSQHDSAAQLQSKPVRMRLKGLKYHKRSRSTSPSSRRDTKDASDNLTNTGKGVPISGQRHVMDTTTDAMAMMEVVLSDRLGKRVRVKCCGNDTIGDLKKLVALQTGTRPEKIRIQKWYNVYKDHISLDDYEIRDGMGLELFYD